MITGASSGVGEAFVRALARRGMDVLLAALPQDRTRLDGLAREPADSHTARVRLRMLAPAAHQPWAWARASVDDGALDEVASLMVAFDVVLPSAP
jgi:NAD(P)-dependent dehydrogenase (short-subunit alcohol dehydrogenase family)